MWRAFIVKYHTMRRKSLISRGGHIGIGITLLRQTVITVIFTVPINSSIFRLVCASKPYQSFSVSQNGVLVQFSTSWTIALNPLGAHNNNAKILYMYLNNAMQVIQRRTPHFAGCSLKHHLIIKICMV